MNKVLLEISEINFELAKNQYSKLSKAEEKVNKEISKLKGKKQVLEAEIDLIKAYQTYYNSNTYHLSLDHARILKEKLRSVIQVIIPVIVPNVLKLTKGFGGEDFQQYQALSQKNNVSPGEKNLKVLYND